MVEKTVPDQPFPCTGIRNESRRHLISGATSIATVWFVNSLLPACRSNGTSQDLKEVNPIQSVASTTELWPILTTGPFMEHYKAIQARPESYPNIQLPDASLILDNELFRDKKISLLLRLLILYRIKKDSFALMDELRSEGIKVLAPPGDGPALILSHFGVTGEVLNPERTQKIGGSDSLQYSLSAFGPEMPHLLGHFLLTDDLVERHDAEKALIMEAMRPPDVKDWQNKFDRMAEALVQKALNREGFNGEIDLVQDVSKWLPLEVIKEYFGVPLGIDAQGFRLKAEDLGVFPELKLGDEVRPTEADFYQWTARTFTNFVLNVSRDPKVAALCRPDGYKMVWYLGRLVETELAKTSTSSATVLARLAKLYREKPTHAAFLTHDPEALNPEGKKNPLAGLFAGPTFRIAAILGGLLSAGVVPVEEGAARVVDVLLDPSKKSALDQALKVAQQANASVELQKYVKEGLRFRPQTEIVPRIVLQDVEIESVKIPKGKMVFVCFYSAMMDTSVVGASGPVDEFVIGRPESHYLMFGFERNSCAGRYLAPMQMAAALRAIFLVAPNGIARASALQFIDDSRPGDNLGPYAQSLKIKLI